jgi:hypothetical protein
VKPDQQPTKPSGTTASTDNLAPIGPGVASVSGPEGPHVELTVFPS